MVKIETYFYSVPNRISDSNIDNFVDIKVDDAKQDDPIPFKLESSFPDAMGSISINIDGVFVIPENEVGIEVIWTWEDIAKGIYNSNFFSKKIEINYTACGGNYIEFTPIDNQKVEVCFPAENYKAIADKKELIHEIVRAGTIFFKKIEELLPSESDRCKVGLMLLKDTNLAAK